MQQFIPFEDEWDILERLSPEALIPYHVGVPCRHDMAANDHCTGPAAPVTAPASQAQTPGNTRP
ncbi:hypothetical protein [Dyella japonica]|uniref:Uncharacterized protein n=1 Tax=Dyella japonica A8 TaxID=1217721 RepID=A0A075JW28_9GAMM|nr:hypothetical protein [Dyella japonica]AIF45755.1 hypothetical protein HY57_00005 [Dyella japonica A8]